MISKQKFGKRSGVSSAYPYVVEGGIDPFPESPGELTIVSSSVEDKEGGNGVSAVNIEGVAINPEKSKNFLKKFSLREVSIDGTTPVVLDIESLQDFGLGWSAFRVHTIDSTGQVGASGSNVGTIKASIGGVDCASVLPGRGRTEMAVYTTDSYQIDAHLESIMFDFISSVSSSTVNRVYVSGELFMREVFRDGVGPWRIRDAALTSRFPAAGVLHKFKDKTFPIFGNCDLRVAITDLNTESGNVTVSSGFVIEWNQIDTTDR